MTGGAEFILCCDIRVGAEVELRHHQFADGTVAGAGGTRRLPYCRGGCGLESC